jgi:TOMM system kinase/cyclase fusion protein
MDFYDILDQVIALLKQRGRASYRALQRQFALDDAYLEDLKVEIIKVQRLAVDQDGELLIWTGEAETKPPPTPKPPVQQESSLAEHATPGEVLRTAPHSPEAERRQLTVMFCDLVDSTKLSSQLDPEEYRDVVRAYQSACTEVITRFDGYIAQLLGDGLLVYFGYPHAHEDDAQRAVRTGLGILAAMGDLNKALQQTKGIQLAIRLGVHTGLVVIGDMGSSGRQEQLALGETPNVAARIQGLATPNTLVISDATSRLVQGYFACQDLGAQALRGVAEPIAVYRVLSESGATSRLDVAQPRGLTPLVGREQEVGLLEERWEQVKAGQGQVVLLTGDAGIGKSRLVQRLKEHVANEPHTRWECRSAEYAQNTALFPLTDLFQRLLQFHTEDTPDEKFGKLERALSQFRLPIEESVQLFAPLFSLPLPEDRYPALNLSPQRQRQKTLETIVAILLELAERQPVLFILEDLHWTDPSTLELLNLLLDQTPTASILTVLTCRPTFQPSWSHRSYLSEITVNRVSHTQVEQIVAGVTDGKTFPAEVLRQIIEKTDGVPLFIEEITKAILESGQLKALDGHYEFTGSLRTLTIPATLQDSLMARLDRLISAKGIAQLGAVIGRQFAFDLLYAVSQLDETTLQRELRRLVDAELVYQRGVPPQSTYMFKHALIQDAAYASLLKSTRQQYHKRIAQVLEEQFPETAEAEPELLAHHCTEAGLTVQAVPYCHTAAQRAVERSAHVEAISHLRTGLALLQTLPETQERTHREVDLLIALGASLNTTQGAGVPEVGQTYTYARQLCQQLDNPYQLFPILRGLWVYHLVRVEQQTAQALGEELLTLAQHTHDPVMLVTARCALGATLLPLGAVATAHAHFTQALTLYDPPQHRGSAFRYTLDAGVVCHSYAAWTFWALGYPDQGLAQRQHAVTLAQQLAHPFSLGFALNWAARFHQFRREGSAAQQCADASLHLATEQGFPLYAARGAMVRGWARVQQGQPEAGMAQMHQSLHALGGIGHELARLWALALLAEGHGAMGQPEAGLTVLAEALSLVESGGERFYAAELHRLKGELLLQQSLDNAIVAESCFHQAISIAQNQQAKTLELRAATSLARLWQSQGKHEEARQVLGDVYGWFTEGFETADLQDAKVLLDALSENQG